MLKHSSYTVRSGILFLGYTPKSGCGTGMGVASSQSHLPLNPGYTTAK